VTDECDSEIERELFSEAGAEADIYWCFDRIMNLGLKYLYETTRDMNEIKKELEEKFNRDQPANSQKADTKQGY
jgi:hypothetical protein